MSSFFRVCSKAEPDREGDAAVIDPDAHPMMALVKWDDTNAYAIVDAEQLGWQYPGWEDRMTLSEGKP